MTVEKSCVYLTTYSGNKMPNKYIGSTYSKNINTDYHGSVNSKKYGEIWREEIKNNPHLFKTEIILEFSKRNDAYDFEELLQRKLNVISDPTFINLSYANKGFSAKGITWSKKSKLKVTGKNHWNYGGHHSEETKQKIGDRDYSHCQDPKTRKKHSDSMKQTIKNRGGHWCEGQKSHRKGTTIEEEYGIERAEEIRQKIKISIPDKSGKNNPMYGKHHPIVTCPHCQKRGAKPGMIQWHFHKCKLNDSFWEEW